MSYIDLAAKLDQSYSYFDIQSINLENKTLVQVDSLEVLAKRYIDAVQSALPEGGCIFMCASRGGAMAYEMAKQVRKINMQIKSKNIMGDCEVKPTKENSVSVLIMFALFLALFLDGFGQTFIFPILTKMLFSANTTHTLALKMTMHDRQIFYGITIGAYYLFWMLGAAVLGDLSDSYGRKKALIICILGMGLGTLLTAYALVTDNVLLIVVGRVLVGMTAGGQAIAQAAVADISSPENQVRNTGYIMLAVSLGAILGPVYGQLFSDPHVVSWFSEQIPFYGVAILAFISMIILLIFYRDTYQPDYKPVKFMRLYNVFSEAFRQPRVRILVLSSLGIFGCWAIYFFYMSIYLVTVFHASGWGVSMFMTMYGVGLSVGMAILPAYIEKRFTITQAAVGGWSCMLVAMVLSQFSPWITAEYVLAVIAGMGIGIGFLFIMKAFSNQATTEKQGWIMGIFNASWVGMMGVTVMCAGYLASLSNSAPFVLAYILFFIGIYLFITRVTTEKKEELKDV